MKRSEIQVSVKLGDVLNAPYCNSWSELCDKYGIGEWCINEGQADENDTVMVSLKDADRWGLIEDETEEDN